MIYKILLAAKPNTPDNSEATADEPNEDFVENEPSGQPENSDSDETDVDDIARDMLNMSPRSPVEVPSADDLEFINDEEESDQGQVNCWANCMLCREDETPPELAKLQAKYCTTKKMYKQVDDQGSKNTPSTLNNTAENSQSTILILDSSSDSDKPQTSTRRKRKTKKRKAYIIDSSDESNDEIVKLDSPIDQQHLDIYLQAADIVTQKHE